MNKKKINRREFLKTNSSILTGAALAGMIPKKINAEQIKPVRIGVVGTGNRGRSLTSNLLKIDKVEIPAVCDIDPEALAKVKKIIVEAEQPNPEEYTGETDYKKLMERDDLDAVIIATPWDLHNWSFRPDNLAVLNMIRQGLLGNITHIHCAHSHDCIDHWFFDKDTGNDRWSAKYLVEHNRDQYPTHQQGPVLSWANINCGDYYNTLTSTATDSFVINEYFKRRFPGHANGERKYAQGDIVTTVVRTKLGKSIVINYDMQSPRPYDNRWMVQGTRGIYNEQRNSVYLLEKSPEYHQWETFDPYFKKYQHRFAESSFGGHGGADGIMLNQFVEAVRNKTPLPLSLYDGVLMAAIGPLSEMSIAENSKAIQVPDFTRGKWKTRKPDFAI